MTCYYCNKDSGLYDICPDCRKKYVHDVIFKK